MRRRARAGLGMAAVGAMAAALLPACFPDYAVGTGDGGGPRADGGPDTGDSGGMDSTTGPSDGSPGTDAPGADSTTGGDGATHADGGGIGDSSFPPYDSPYDGNPLANMVVVDGGTFYFQVDEISTTVNAQATLAYTVAIDATEVTVADFGRWLASGPTAPPDGASLDPGGPYETIMTWEPTSWGWDDNSILGNLNYSGNGCASDFGNPLVTWGQDGNYPITCVPWPQALAYCAWQHKRLPTETEWRYFATGQGTRAPYPWAGTTLDCSHVSTQDDSGAGCIFPVAVGTASAGRSKDGVFDLVGSMSEWLWDWLPISGTYTYPANAGTNYAGPPGDVDAAAGRLSRMWINSDFTDILAQDYLFDSTQGRPGSSDTSVGYDNCGFRCAKSLP
jgi:formylglycine-generating enzyme required for sulfatase activity